MSVFTHAQGDDWNVFETSIGHSTEFFVFLGNVQGTGDQPGMELRFDLIEHLSQMIDATAVEI